jgi:hypothetical protein
MSWTREFADPFRFLRTLAMRSRASGSARTVSRLFISHQYVDTGAVSRLAHQGSTGGLSQHCKAQMRNGPADQRLAHDIADRLLHDGIGASIDRQVPLDALGSPQPIGLRATPRAAVVG